MMKRIQYRQFEKLEYGDPRGFLLALRKRIENEFGNMSHADLIRILRSNSLKSNREMIQAALFCVGLEELIDVQVKFSPVENQDYDVVATWVKEDCRTFRPVQLKEVVPDELNSTASVQRTIGALRKYADSSDLAVAIYINRDIRFDPTLLQIPTNLAIGELWIYGAISEDRWALWGDLLAPADRGIGTVYRYPE